MENTRFVDFRQTIKIRDFEVMEVGTELEFLFCQEVFDILYKGMI